MAVAHNLGCKLIIITCYKLKLASFPGKEPKLKQPVRCMSLICSYMRTFPLKVHYKAIKMRWLDMEANAYFHRDYYKQRKLGGLLGMTTKSLRIILKYFTGCLGRSESLYPGKKALFGSPKVHTLKKICHHTTCGEIISHFSTALHVVQHGLYTSNLLPLPMFLGMFYQEALPRFWVASRVNSLLTITDRHWQTLATTFESANSLPFARNGCLFMWGACFCMGAYKHDVVVIKMGAYIHGVFTLCGCLLS